MKIIDIDIAETPIPHRELSILVHLSVAPEVPIPITITITITITL
jgi:hypothetical protein